MEDTINKHLPDSKTLGAIESAGVTMQSDGTVAVLVMDPSGDYWMARIDADDFKPLDDVDWDVWEDYQQANRAAPSGRKGKHGDWRDWEGFASGFGAGKR